MKNELELSFLQVTSSFEKKTKDYIIKEYIKHYDKRISKSQYIKLYEKMGELIKNRKENTFFIALTEKEEIIGAISISLYDNRIINLQKRYDKKNIGEIGRCYIQEKFRRKGIASKLFQLCNTFAIEKKYEKLYLHTHYFLPGGFPFWKEMGFKIILDEKNSLQTVHMEKSLT